MKNKCQNGCGALVKIKYCKPCNDIVVENRNRVRLKRVRDSKKYAK